jgi:hypothetical protein
MALLSGAGSAALKSADRTNFAATAGQTTFNIAQGYSVGDVDVFLNGVKLQEGDDYYATNGTSVVLNSGAALNDFVQVVSYNQFIVANTYTKSETDSRYMVATGSTPMTSYLRTPNYGVSSWSDTANASLEASVGSGTNGVGIKAWGRSVPGSGGELTYVTDTRGAGGQHIWYGYNGTSLSQLMKIDTAGRMTRPLQPRFFARSNYASSSGPSGVYVFGTVDLNVGGSYNSTNGRFTAPVAGTYYIYACALSRASTGLNSHLRINGSPFIYSEDSRSGSYGDVHPRICVNLNAGDYVEFYVANATYGGLYDYFGGWLVA